MRLERAESSGAVHALKCELADETLRNSGKLRLQVRGWSMLPAVLPDDTLVIESVTGPVEQGNIVLYRRDGRLFAHRVLAAPSRENGHVITQGDALPFEDAPVPISELLGKVAYIIRKGKLIVPEKTPALPRRAIAGLIRRSDSAARVFVSVHRLRQSF